MYLAQFNTYKEVVMGRFSTTVHVKDNVGRIEFINSFCGIMKNHGFAFTFVLPLRSILPKQSIGTYILIIPL